MVWWNFLCDNKQRFNISVNKTHKKRSLIKNIFSFVSLWSSHSHKLWYKGLGRWLMSTALPPSVSLILTVCVLWLTCTGVTATIVKCNLGRCLGDRVTFAALWNCLLLCVLSACVCACMYVCVTLGVSQMCYIQSDVWCAQWILGGRREVRGNAVRGDAVSGVWRGCLCIYK